MAAVKKKSKKSKASAPEDDTLITIDAPGIEPFAAAGPIEIPEEDGGVTIDFGQKLPDKIDADFDDNLAEFLDNIVLGQISTSLLEAIEQDERDRSGWLQERTDGLELLGMKVEKPGGANVGSSSTAVPGQSTVRDALLAEAIDRFQANAFAELCPAVGPCKITNYDDETIDDDKLAEDFEKDFNYYLTGSGPNTAKEYYPDTKRMLWWTGYASGMFKKVYKCPLRNRPVSESVDGSDLIVPSNATDLHNAGRITHQISMNHVTLKQMQVQGAYRDVVLTAPTPQPNALQNKQAEIVGMNANPQRPEDQDYTIFECYCNLDIPGFEHERNGKQTGLPVPYRVVIDKDSRTVLEIRRNWKELTEEDHKTSLPQAKIPFVLFPYATGLGPIYGTGLLQRLGNYTMALTAMLRECIDAGMFASFPGFLFAKPMGRQLQNEFRVPPGGGAPIDVSAVGGNINNAVMPLPYKDVSTAMVALMAQTRDNAARYGGTAEAPTGEGVMNAPVGSVLAAIDQSTRIEGGVHKGLYAAQREELELFRDLFAEDPEAMFRGNERSAMGRIPEDADDHAREAARQKRLARFKKALKKCRLCPASDPNVPSHMHRVAKANTLLQTAMAMPGVFDMRQVVKGWAAMVKIDDVESFFAPVQAPQLPPPDPIALGNLQVNQQNAETRRMDVMLKHQGSQAKLKTEQEMEATRLAIQHSNTLDQANGQPDPLQHRALDIKEQQVQDAHQKAVLDAQTKHADRNSKEAIEALKVAQAAFVHPEATPIANAEMGKMSEIIAPAAGNNEPPMSGGGRVHIPEPTEEELEAAYQAGLSRILTDYVRDYRSRQSVH